MTSSPSCCGSRPPPTTCPFSSTTERWNTAIAHQPRARCGQEEHLQPNRSARDPARLQPALSRPPLRTGRFLGQPARGIDRLTKPRAVDGRVEGDRFLLAHRQGHAGGVAEPEGQHRRGPPGRSACHARAVLPTSLSRHLRRFRDLGVIKRVTGTYRYYLTKAGRAATAAACRITETMIIPAMI